MRTTHHNVRHAFVVLLLTVSGVVAGCAHTPKEPALLSCSELDREIRGTEQARRYAMEKLDDPWTFVIPFAAGGTNASAKSAVGDADRWLATLRETSRERGCTRSS